MRRITAFFPISSAIWTLVYLNNTQSFVLTSLTLRNPLLHSQSTASLGRIVSSSSLHAKKQEDNNEDSDNEVNEYGVIDPDTLQKMQQKEEAILKLQRAKAEIAKRQQASAQMDLPTQPLVQTIGGGTSTIFEMARQMWNTGDAEGKTSLPRWHPTTGISPFNTDFRTTSPTMNQQGYAGTIWRNVRKRSKPSMWRYALRTYDRMIDSNVECTNVHYEGALVACAKLGLWERALEIYNSVKEREAQLRRLLSDENNLQVHVTDHMVLSLIRACVRGSRQSNKQRRREPLDAATKVLKGIEENHGLYLDALHVNPLASAYQALGLTSEAAVLLQTNLSDRTSGPEPEEGQVPFNVNDVGAKDKGSYALLVNGAVSDGDWAGAVDALRDMTEAGLYPSSRHLNTWTEVSERKMNQRTTRSWKKKRDEYWLESVR